MTLDISNAIDCNVERILSGLREEDSAYNLISHYTSVKSIFHILASQSMFFSSSLHMNDPEDGFQLYRVFCDVIDILNREINGGELFPIVEGGGLLHHFDPDEYTKSVFENRRYEYYLRVLYDSFVWLESHRGGSWSTNTVYPREYSHIYVACFSRSNGFDGILPLWQAYAENGIGVRLDYSEDVLQNYIEKINSNHDYSLIMKDVVYLSLAKMRDFSKSLICDLYHDIVKNVSSINELYNFCENIKLNIMKMSMYVKEDSYRYENEVRIIFYDKNKEFKINYIPRQGMIVPYLEIPFRNNIIYNIVCGPCSDPRLLGDIKRYLNSPIVYPTLRAIDDERNSDEEDSLFYRILPELYHSGINYRGKIE